MNPDIISAVKIPIYNSADPSLWFGMCESTFQLATPKPITDSKTKFNYCVAHLPPDAASTVRDTILNPDASDPYKNLKDSIIARCGETSTQAIRKLLAGEQLGDRKPTELLRVMKSRAEPHQITDTLLLELFLSQLPVNVQSIIASIMPTTSQKAAEVADRILEVTPSQIEPQNIFYSKSSNTLKIGDFGLATLAGCVEDVSNEGVSNLHSSSIGTLPYAAPEQIKGQSYDSKVDIYSLGIILIELLNNFSTAMEFYRGIDQIRKGNFPNEMKQSPKLMNLVKNLVNEKPEDRMSAKELLCYLHEDSKVTLQEREMAVQEKELFLNEKEILLREKEEFLLNEKEILLRETEAALREKDAALHEKDEEILRLRALVKELSLIK